MIDPASTIVMASTTVAGLGLTSAAALKGWREWLDVKRLETSSTHSQAPRPSMTCKEISDLKQRIARLEAIANGTDL
jgi:hypothetical protein